MAVIVTRAGKGSPLTNNEVDANFVNLNNEVGTKANAGTNTDITSLAPDHINFDTTPLVGTLPAVGRLFWDVNYGTLQLGLAGGNVNLQIGQEINQYVLNKTGSTLLDGRVVKVTGAQGNRATVDYALADGDLNSATVLGVLTESIANNAQGFCTTEGLVNDVDTSAFTDGDVLYLSPTSPGVITNVKPVAPQHMVMIGYCVRAHASVGKILVKVQNGYELNELHDVLISTPVDQQALIYDGTLQVWKNAAVPSTGDPAGTAVAMAIALG